MTMECALFIFVARCSNGIVFVFTFLAVHSNNCEDLYMLVLSNMPDPVGV